MKTAPATRSGWSPAISRPRCAPRELPTITARSTSFASRTSIASRANSLSAQRSTVGGRSERPLPRGSNVRTRKWRERYGIWAFHWREWTSDQVGSRRIVVSPCPYDSQNTRTPSRSMNPILIGMAGPRLLAISHRSAPLGGSGHTTSKRSTSGRLRTEYSRSRAGELGPVARHRLPLSFLLIRVEPFHARFERAEREPRPFHRAVPMDRGIQERILRLSRHPRGPAVLGGVGHIRVEQDLRSQLSQGEACGPRPPMVGVVAKGGRCQDRPLGRGARDGFDKRLQRRPVVAILIVEEVEVEGPPPCERQRLPVLGTALCGPRAGITRRR